MRGSSLLLLVSVILVVFVVSSVWLRAQVFQTLRFGDTTLSVEIADTDAKKAKGLGERDSLGGRSAMLFPFDESGNHCFWMKGMKFSIDMIWLDWSKKVVHIERDVRPESFPESFCPTSSAKYVIEVNAGLSQALNVDVGSQL